MNIYLMRHGHYDRTTRHLDAQGRDEVIYSVHQLHERGVGALALILCSTAIRTQETAQIVAEEFPTRVMPARGLEVFGFNPDGLVSLDSFLDEMLEGIEVELDEESSLLVITHQPLLDRARLDGQNTEEGEIFEYVRGSWHNPYVA